MQQRGFRIIISAFCVREVVCACGVSQLLRGDGFLFDGVSHPREASNPIPFRQPLPGKCNLKVLDLMAVFEVLSDGADKELIIFRPLNLGDGL